MSGVLAKKKSGKKSNKKSLPTKGNDCREKSFNGFCNESELSGAVRVYELPFIISPTHRVWPSYTLTDPLIVNEYVQKVHNCWLHWSQGKGVIKDRVKVLHKIISDIHAKCGISQSLLRSYSLSVKHDIASGISSFSNGMFKSTEWRMEINDFLVKEKILSAENFLSIVEAVYHEGRHVEQFWLIIVDALFAWRHEITPNEYAVFDTDIEDLYRKTGIPHWVLHEAAKKACFRPEIPHEHTFEHEKLVAMIKNWWDYYYGRHVNSAAEIYANISTCERAYHKYVSHLPAEADAFSIQGLIRERLSAIPAFADEVKKLNQVDPILGYCTCSL